MASRPAGNNSALVSGLAAGRQAAALAAILLALLALVCALPFADAAFNRQISHRAGPLIFLLGAVFYCLKSAAAAAPGPERRFWGKLAGGFVCWSVTYVPTLFSGLWGGIDAIRTYTDFGFAAAYAAIVAAVEERPDDRSPSTELGRRPALWQAMLLMAGFYGTMVVLPQLYNPGAANLYVSSFSFWVFIDLVVAARLAYFAIFTAGRRWRFIYLMFCGAFLAMTVVDFGTFWLRRQQISVTSGTFLDALWTVPYGLLMVAATAGLLRIDDRRGREREPTLSDAFAASSLIWALFFPGFHFAADFVGWLDPQLRVPRDLLILIWTCLLMSLAVLRQRQLEASLARLVQERREIEGSLRDNEQDLRLLVERNRVAERLRAAEERFAKAFEVCPDALVLSSFREGVILDVNPAFERLTLLPRAACLGKRALELDLWSSPRSRERLVQLLQRRQQMHDIPGELRRADGRVRPVRASYERLQEPDGELLLTVLRDPGAGVGTRSGRIATLLENTRIPLRLVHQAESGESFSLFANAGARLAVRRHRDDDVEIQGGEGLRLLLHLRGAESEAP